MADPTELLKSVLVLQHQAARALITEFHQQTEAFVQQFKRLPLSDEPAEPSGSKKFSLRDAAPLESYAVSPLIQAASKRHCGADVAARSPDSLELFMGVAKRDVKTPEDRLHALFVLEASLSKSGELCTRFESKLGYDLLVEWFALCCSYKDDSSKSFTELLLMVFQRHPPSKQFTFKKVARDLVKYKKFVKGKKNKELFQKVLDQYREAIHS